MTAIVPMKVIFVRKLYLAGYCCNQEDESETDEPEPLKQDDSIIDNSLISGNNYMTT